MSLSLAYLKGICIYNLSESYFGKVEYHGYIMHRNEDISQIYLYLNTTIVKQQLVTFPSQLTAWIQIQKECLSPPKTRFLVN